MFKKLEYEPIKALIIAVTRVLFPSASVPTEVTCQVSPWLTTVVAKVIDIYTDELTPFKPLIVKEYLSPSLIISPFEITPA